MSHVDKIGISIEEALFLSCAFKFMCELSLLPVSAYDRNECCSVLGSVLSLASPKSTM